MVKNSLKNGIKIPLHRIFSGFWTTSSPNGAGSLMMQSIQEQSGEENTPDFNKTFHMVRKNVLE